MRSALTISIALHLLISLIAFNWVSFREVRYIPRQVYNVTIVPEVAQAQPAPKPEPPKPEPVEAEPEPEPEPEEMPPPPVKPKPKPKPDPKKTRKEVPKTDIQEPKPDAEQTEQDLPSETGEMSLDTDDFPFAPYINRVRHKIAANWRVPEGSQGEERFCRVYFRIQRNGGVTAVTVEESSGLFMFDQAAKRAVVNAAPLPPLPREYRDTYLGVHFSFVYREER